MIRGAMIAALALLPGVLGGAEKMQELLNKLVANATAQKLNARGAHLEVDGDGTGPDVHLKSIMMTQLINIMDLDDYGCWCYFDGKYGQGHGPPVDEFDKQCQHLHQAYDCAVLDAQDKGEECVAWDVDYSIFQIYTRMHIYDECYAQNAGNNCAVNACAIELNFIFFLFERYFQNEYPDTDQFSHAKGFDGRVGCGLSYLVEREAQGQEWLAGQEGEANRPKTEEEEEELEEEAVDYWEADMLRRTYIMDKPKREKQCCGQYPYRFTFKPEDGTRACCGQKTYDTQLLSCCPGNEIKGQCSTESFFDFFPQ